MSKSDNFLSLWCLYSRRGQLWPSQIVDDVMTTEEHNWEQFTAMVRRYKDTVQRIARIFYPPDTYRFKALECDLTTYLWMDYRQLPEDAVIHDERAWINTIVYRRASIFVRDEQSYQSQLVYDADLSNVADTDTDPHVTRMYRLIDRLDSEDQDVVTMYIGKIPIRDIAIAFGMSQAGVYRRIRRIVAELCRLNTLIGDEDDAAY